ncbi:MAG: gluconate 2-dehydrogenase subunit 3 family protein [Candidatus Heimdallarchaeota archaeon]|nr:gluconate 2-dehydrogenase subunit 3 family protein [Candidatus Heimdallarchaeota archaeon]
MLQKNLTKLKSKSLMNRRKALKNLSLSLGYVVAAPTLMNILSSCTAEVETWKPLFLSGEQKNLVTHLVDIILPSSNIPGALDVNVPQFIDKMFNDVESESNQEMFQKGATAFAQKFEATSGENASKGSKESVQQLFETYFNLSEEEIQTIKKEQRLPEDEVSADRKDDYLIYKFLFTVRSYTLFGYYTSEKVGEEILSYDPIPGSYDGCVPLADIGNAWSL